MRNHIIVCTPKDAESDEDPSLCVDASHTEHGIMHTYERAVVVAGMLRDWHGDTYHYTIMSASPVVG